MKPLSKTKSVGPDGSYYAIKPCGPHKEDGPYFVDEWCCYWRLYNKLYE